MVTSIIYAISKTTLLLFLDRIHSACSFISSVFCCTLLTSHDSADNLLAVSVNDFIVNDCCINRMLSVLMDICRLRGRFGWIQILIMCFKTNRSLVLLVFFFFLQRSNNWRSLWVLQSTNWPTLTVRTKLQVGIKYDFYFLKLSQKSESKGPVKYSWL